MSNSWFAGQMAPGFGGQPLISNSVQLAGVQSVSLPVPGVLPDGSSFLPQAMPIPPALGFSTPQPPEPPLWFSNSAAPNGAAPSATNGYSNGLGLFPGWNQF